MRWATSQWTALQLTLERSKHRAMQIQPHLRKIERSILSSSFHLKMLEEVQNYTEWSQDVWHKSPYKALCPLNAHKEVCHKNNSFAVLSLWVDCEELRPLLQSGVLKFFHFIFQHPFLFPRSSCPWECLYLEKLPAAQGEGRTFCLTWTLQDSKRTFLALHKSSEGWLEN